MKKFNLAALPLAVAGVLASTSAFAGTEACFEVYKATSIDAHDTIYDEASCAVNPRAASASDTELKENDIAKIAYELTGDLPVDFGTDLSGDPLQVVYVPTTDIPGGTKITINLNGAVWDGNANQIHLISNDGSADAAVASSDGTLDGASSVVFLTKSGITIGAGSRLAFSRSSTVVEPVGIKLANTTCTDTASSLAVSLEAVEAKTDGGLGYDIQGGISAVNDIVDVSAQYWAFQGGSTAEVNVNAESSDDQGVAIVARTEFVYDSTDTANQLVAKQTEAVFKTAFYDREAALDLAVTMGADDEVLTKFVASADPDADVKMALWNSRLAATGALDESVEVEDGTTLGEFGLDEATATEYDTEFTDLFTPEATGGDPEANPAAVGTTLEGANYNEMFYVVTNTVTDNVMNFNYQVDVNYTLDFDNTDYIDHCAKTVKSHKIGVNGAVLKVPYVTTATGNFVRVTNEHDEQAEVTFDMFGESVDGTEANRHVAAVALGTVPAKSSVVYMMTDVLAAAEAEGYLGADGGYAAGDLGDNFQSSNSRHTVTFTVTAPRDSVHGVSVQKIIGAVADRVMPVLDQNEWSQ
jgi:hypothetical protein